VHKVKLLSITETRWSVLDVFEAVDGAEVALPDFAVIPDDDLVRFLICLFDAGPDAISISIGL
jgi:hypothetical protein